MKKTLISLLKHFDNPSILKANVIPRSCPIPCFGDLSQSKVATVGLNPSNREFVDAKGRELDGDEKRRFPTLTFLKINRWSERKERHLRLIIDDCKNYFSGNSYDGWFKKLDNIISGMKVSYYDKSACHLDLVPYATKRKWAKLTKEQQSLLLNLAGNSLARLIRESPIRLLVLNGKTVVNNFKHIAEINLEPKEMPRWALKRKNGLNIRGFAYKGVIGKMADIKLKREILVLGFNHNIQSSHGLTNQVKNAIRDWVTKSANEVLR